MQEIQYKTILTALLDMLDEGVHIVDSNGMTIFYNAAMQKIEQMKMQDIIGHDFFEVSSNMGLEQGTIYHALVDGASTLNMMQKYTNLAGKSIYSINSTIPILDESKELLAVIEVADNITHLTELSERILQLQDQMTQSKDPNRKKIRRYHFSDIIGNDPDFLKCIERAKRAAMNDAPVFIYGETGTGKELFAQSIHYGGKRALKPFIAQNCAALPGNLLESLLFGTKKGSFTGALDMPGLFEQANGGTLLLDELNSMPYEMQSKLLRVLQESYIRRVGGAEDIPIDVRVIATVNEDPLELVEQGRLRQDLYYRLNAVSIRIPPLRERRSDIPQLVELLIHKHAKTFDKHISYPPRRVIELLMEYDYPGNVRELENIIIQALFLMDEEEGFTQDVIDIPKLRRKVDPDSMILQAGEALQDYLDRIEKDTILRTLDKCGGNISRCAACLHMKRQTLQHKLKKYEILS